MNKKAFIFIFTVIILFGLFLLFNLTEKKATITSSSKDQVTNTDVSLTDMFFGKNKSESKDINKDTTSLKSIAYLKRSQDNSQDPNHQGSDNEVWLMDVDGSNKRKLDINGVSEVYKYPDKDTLIYLKRNINDSIFIYELDSQVEFREVVLSQLDKGVVPYIQISDVRFVAPDHSAVVIIVNYFGDCSSEIPDNQMDIGDAENIPMGSGPCEVEAPEKYKGGMYIYNFENRRINYLGLFSLPSTWDLSKKGLYFVEDNGIEGKNLKYINYQTGEIDFIKKGETFGYAEYPFTTIDKTVRFDGETDPESLNTLSLSNLYKNEAVILDSGRWADIQPFASFSPNEKTVLYTRTKPSSIGPTYGVLFAIDPKNESVRQVTQNNDDYSYRPFGYWVDDKNFVTTETYFLDENQQSQGNWYSYAVVSINTDTGKVTTLDADNIVLQ